MTGSAPDIAVPPAPEIGAADILGARILLVDDLAANISLLERILRGAGYRDVSSTTDSRTVSALYAAEHHDLILLDLQMPHMDGFAVMDALKLVEPEGYLPVLVITAQPDHKLRALRAGAKDFVSKPFDIAEVLTRVHNMLEVRLLVAAVRRKNAELRGLINDVIAERKRSERLALHVAPGSIAERLPDRPDASVESAAAVTVLVADVVGFAELAPSQDHALLATCLDELFLAFDALTETLGMRKVKTRGNSYLAAAGVTAPMNDHATRAVSLADGMMQALVQFNERSSCALQVRIGIASGSAVAAFIGRRRYLYDLWGDVVTIAAGMESHGVAGRVQLSASTRALLGEALALDARGTMDVEGLGPVQTWFLR